MYVMLDATRVEQGRARGFEGVAAHDKEEARAAQENT
jgi:hypothetical protein